MSNLDFCQLVEEYARLQLRLVTTFLETVNPSDRIYLTNIPKRGTIVSDGEVWRYTKHGGGVTFESGSGVRVSAHTDLAEVPDGVEPWRIFVYLESTHVLQMVTGGQAVPVSCESVEAAFRDNVRSGVLVPLTTRMGHALARCSALYV